MSVFMVTCIRVIKGKDDFITDASTYVRLLSGPGTNTVDQAVQAFKEGFLESKYHAKGWELLGTPVLLEITRNFVDSHLECFTLKEIPEVAKPATPHLRLVP